MDPKSGVGHDFGDNKGMDNEGEGNKTADRRYRKEAEKYAHSGQVDEAAREAKRAVDEGNQEIKDADAKARKHTAGDLKSDLRGRKS
jgi:hypothetical protein